MFLTRRNLRMSGFQRLLAYLFFLVVLVFALIYYIIWLLSPDAFIVHAEANFKPVEALQLLALEGRSPEGVGSPVPLSSYSRDVAELFKQAQEASRRRKDIQSAIEDLESNLDRVHATLKESLPEGVEFYESEKLASLSEERARLTELIERIEGAVEDHNQLFQPNRIISADLRADLSQIDLRLAQERLASSEAMIEEYRGLAQPEDLTVVEQVSSEVRLHQDTLTRVDREYSMLRRRADELLSSIRTERAPYVGFLHFFSFSLGISTTTTFGDIVPNNDSLRLLISLQLMISVLIVGSFLNKRESEKPVPLAPGSDDQHARA